MSARWPFGRSLLALLPLAVISALSRWKHYQLPAPVIDTYDTSTGIPQVSESAILDHARYLSENIGFRTVGTREHALGDAWMLSQAYDLQELCNDVVRKEPGRHLECEVWHQVGSGSHRFDILGKRLYKTYVNLTNVVVRISDGTDEGKSNALLANAHVDSTLPSPGAADDALAVGALLEAARTLVRTPGWEPAYALVMLFNNAEESLQDGSHLFSTAHPVRDTVRAVLNLEAAGTKGLSLVFQATSPAMVEAYSHVPHPYGTIIAHDVFSSGIIMSDTDFRQFQTYLGVPGLDIAVVGHSYFYHTRKDLVEHIEPGVAQHMGETAQALIQYMTARNSSLVEDHAGRQRLVYFSLLNTFFVQYTFGTATALHAVLLTASIALIAVSPRAGTSVTAATATIEEITENEKVLPNGEKVTDVEIVATKITARGVQDGRPSLLRTFGLLHGEVGGAIAAANTVAAIMRYVINRPLSWYKHEHICLFLYGPAALLGALSVMRLNERTIFRHNAAEVERSLLHVQLLVYAIYACALQYVGIGSAVLFSLSGIGLFIGLLFDVARNRYGSEHVPLVTYFVGQVLPQFFGVVVFCMTMDIFVPLTGRMGAEAPAEFLIATITAVCAAYAQPLLIPFIARFGVQFVRRATWVALATTLAAIVIFANIDPFDHMHPKRLFVVYNENITTNAVSLGVGTSDKAPGFNALVHDIATFVGSETGSDANLTVYTKPVKVDMHEYNGDWDVLYPFSAFLSPYEIALEPRVSEFASGSDASKAFRIWAENDVVNVAAATRSLRLVIHHPGLIWTTIAFDAQVLSWSLDDDPPKSHARHFVKEASFYGIDTWTLDLVINLSDLPDSAAATAVSRNPHALRVNFVGVQEAGMWPGKAKDKARGGHAMVVLEKLDEWLEEKTSGKVDATLLGCVGGVIDL